jgi:biopolymer transport protein ExbD
VHGEITYKKRPGDEDEDVDMIPLIDVSLVLLIFFIMTATGLAASQTIVLPEAPGGKVLSDPNLLWIGYDYDKRGEIVYSLGWGESAAAPQDQNITTQEKLLERLDANLQENPHLIGVNLRGGEEVPWGVDRWLQDELKQRRVPMIWLGIRSTEE